MNLLGIIVPVFLFITAGSVTESTFWDIIFLTDFEKTSESSKTIPNNLSGIDFASGAFSDEDLKMGTPDELFLANFENWAKEHDISLVGTNKNAKQLFKWSFDHDKDQVELKDVPGILIAAEALYKIPDNVLVVMAGKTIYFSTEDGRSKSIHAAWGINPLDRGIIIEQNVRAATVIHELGHIVDVHGIQGDFADEQNVFSYAKEDRDEIFQVALESKPNDKEKLGYITSYSSNNDLQNFAEHYAYYVVYPDVFRDEMKKDPLLAKKYEFLRDFIFNGKEF